MHMAVFWSGKELTMAEHGHNYEVSRTFRSPAGKMSMHWARYRPGIGNSVKIKTGEVPSETGQKIRLIPLLRDTHIP
jgi:hypothetical protein